MPTAVRRATAAFGSRDLLATTYLPTTDALPMPLIECAYGVVYPYTMQPSDDPKWPRMIPSISDTAAYKANCEAIDRLVGECRYPYIVAWGKFLGLAPETVKEYLVTAEADKAPTEAIQKFDDEWMLLSTIRNESNRRRVIELAQR